jgi:hypothetical protein
VNILQLSLLPLQEALEAHRQEAGHVVPCWRDVLSGL